MKSIDTTAAARIILFSDQGCARTHSVASGVNGAGNTCPPLTYTAHLRGESNAS